MTELEIEDFTPDAELEDFIQRGVFNAHYIWRNQDGALASRIQAYKERKAAHEKRRQALASLRMPPESIEAREGKLLRWYGATGTMNRQLGEAIYDSEQRERELVAQHDAVSLALSRTLARAEVEEVSSLLSKQVALGWLLTKAGAEHDAAKASLESYNQTEAEKRDEKAKADDRRQQERASCVARAAEIKRLLPLQHQPMPPPGQFTGVNGNYQLALWRANIRAGWEQELVKLEQQLARA